METLSLKTLEDLGLQLLEFMVSFCRTLVHLVYKPGRVFDAVRDTGAGSSRAGQIHREDDWIGYASPCSSPPCPSSCNSPSSGR